MLRTVAIVVSQNQFAICGMITGWAVVLGTVALASAVLRGHTWLRWSIWTYVLTGIGLSIWLFWTHFAILGGLSTRTSIPEAEYWNGLVATAFCIINWPMVWVFGMLYFAGTPKVLAFLVGSLALTLSVSAGTAYLLTFGGVSGLRRRLRPGDATAT